MKTWSVGFAWIDHFWRQCVATLPLYFSRNTICVKPLCKVIDCVCKSTIRHDELFFKSPRKEEALPITPWITPFSLYYMVDYPNGADDRNWTCNLLITSQLLYLLSYISILLALGVGLEPTTHRLTADCSTYWAIRE